LLSSLLHTSAIKVAIGTDFGAGAALTDGLSQ
jgi:hypothetical protein